MALINCTFFSETLGFSTSITVILPHYSQSQTIPGTTSNNPKMKTLYLLHGLHDDHTAWLARYYFSLSDDREDNYIAGLSMGGYGAFKLALNYPENYCAAASLSGVLDLASAISDPPHKIQQDFIKSP